jgi:hypothetical protein
MAAMAPPHGTEQYAKGAMAPPAAPTPENVEPFADLLDELDARELAMARFRARNEMMAEVFGPEPISAYIAACLCTPHIMSSSQNPRKT